MKKVVLTLIMTLVLGLTFGSTVSAYSDSLTREEWSQWWSRGFDTSSVDQEPEETSDEEEVKEVEKDYQDNASNEQDEEKQKEEKDDDTQSYSGRFNWLINELFNKDNSKDNQEESQKGKKDSHADVGNGVDGMTEEEQKMFEKVNKERAQQGLEPYEFSPELSEVARKKSLDMVENDYFDHESPTYGSPGEMVRNQGYQFSLIRENIATAGSITTAHAQLMASSAHRSAILGSNYTYVGIGVVETERGGVMITQLFGKK
ncbi:CAP domain-containing protein [Natranaerobius thermophilus]|uniref:SCP-like extracellular n=1 Tax=Natranaerobius thermophilus (strain ATCC BAA-1301 / DSM 18059 / JW/NM-WN-LF) TaxID=457570 RepID=B2A4M2_NATTJ|nr:CAP domain-containing protein [Natranaerobius thermophilus]ACB85197.1 SCP-like extracellular [Natranaerobius thermophilus JW/NM-WN-LF]